MKHSLILFVLGLLCIPAAAQINVKDEDAPVIEIGKFYRNLSDTFHSGTFIYYDGIDIYVAFDTSNQYDNRLSIRLGENRDEALRTISDLEELCTRDVGTRITFERWPGKECSALVADSHWRTEAKNGKVTAGSRMILEAKGFAGYVTLTKKNCVTIKNILTKYNGEL